MTESYPSILCADDDPEVLEQLKEHFTLQGFIVLTATNGVEACLQVKRWAPAAVILDLLIPRLGGIGTLSRMRSFAPTVPVVLISDTVDKLQLVTDAGLSAAGAFQKPLDLARISEALARAGVTPPSLVEAPTASAPASSAQPRILLVDDEPQFREMLAEYLETKDFEVLQAGSGEEALTLVPSTHPHLVMLDLMMTGIGGLETLQRIKAIEPGTCVIMVTAVEDLDVARKALAGGAADYVTKPFTFQYLDSVLDIHMPLGLGAAPAAGDAGAGEITRSGAMASGVGVSSSRF